MKIPTLNKSDLTLISDPIPSINLQNVWGKISPGKPP